MVIRNRSVNFAFFIMKRKGRNSKYVPLVSSSQEVVGGSSEYLIKPIQRVECPALTLSHYPRLVSAHQANSWHNAHSDRQLLSMNMYSAVLATTERNDALMLEEQTRLEAVLKERNFCQGTRGRIYYYPHTPSIQVTLSQPPA